MKKSNHRSNIGCNWVLFCSYETSIKFYLVTLLLQTLSLSRKEGGEEITN